MGDVAPGLHERLVTAGLADRLAGTDAALQLIDELDPAEAHEHLTRHIAQLASRALRAVGGDDRAGVARQVALANDLVRAIAHLTATADGAVEAIDEPGRALLALARPTGIPGPVAFPERPEIPLSASALLVNSRGQPRIGHEVNRELASADRVDLLCAFIKWQGLRILERGLVDLRERGGTLRVITTTYIGATDQRALDRLVESTLR